MHSGLNCSRDSRVCNVHIRGLTHDKAKDEYLFATSKNRRVIKELNQANLFSCCFLGYTLKLRASESFEHGKAWQLRSLSRLPIRYPAPRCLDQCTRRQRSINHHGSPCGPGCACKCDRNDDFPHVSAELTFAGRIHRIVRKQDHTSQFIPSQYCNADSTSVERKKTTNACPCSASIAIKSERRTPPVRSSTCRSARTCKATPVALARRPAQAISSTVKMPTLSQAHRIWHIAVP